MNKEVMTILGFKELIPGGNTNEIWWVNEKENITFYSIPTIGDLFRKIKEKGYNEGINRIQTEIKRILNIY